MNRLVQRILEVRQEVDDARAAGRPYLERVAFLAGLEAAGWLIPHQPSDIRVLTDDLQRRDERV